MCYTICISASILGLPLGGVLISNLKNFAYGVILGISSVIPAFSAGTMAVLLNIFDKILLALDLKNIKKNLPFLAPLALGAPFGVYLCGGFIARLLNTFEFYIDYCFIGMIIGCVPMVYKRAKYEKVKTRNVLIFLFVLFGMYILSSMGSGSALHQELDWESGALQVFLWLFLAGMISGVIAILPGISGTIILVMFGVYSAALEAISTFYLPVLLPLCAGMLAGGALGVVIIKRMLLHHPQALYFGILGLVLGSIFTIYPGLPKNLEGALSVFLMALFAVITYFFSGNKWTFSGSTFKNIQAKSK